MYDIREVFHVNQRVFKPHEQKVVSFKKSTDWSKMVRKHWSRIDVAELLVLQNFDWIAFLEQH